MTKNSNQGVQANLQNDKIASRCGLILIDWLILLEAQQAKNAYLQGIPNTNIKGD